MRRRENVRVCGGRNVLVVDIVKRIVVTSAAGHERQVIQMVSWQKLARGGRWRPAAIVASPVAAFRPLPRRSTLRLLGRISHVPAQCSLGTRLTRVDVRMDGQEDDANEPSPGGRGIPSGIAKKHVLQALADLNDGVVHGFDEPTRYCVLHERAIAIHGTISAACGFDFNAVYGADLARDYIQIHHARSITEVGDKPIDPRTDLRPLCPNCHCMVHREPEKILPVEKLVAILAHRRA
jgi:hypothetical protein